MNQKILDRLTEVTNALAALARLPHTLKIVEAARADIAAATAPKTMPTLHLNGTSSRMLDEGYREVYYSLTDAIKSFEKVEFNGRDYYPQGEEAWKRAREEFADRVLRIEGVQKEILEVLEHIQNTKGGR
jgi:hypothetical protein